MQTDKREAVQHEAEGQPIAQNPNPRANENIQVSGEQPAATDNGRSDEVGTEITDGEAG